MKSILPLLLTATLLTSCTRWHFGENIRESCETHVGIDPSMLYHIGKGQQRITLAREARYEADTPLLTFAPFPDPAGAQDIRFTGKYRQATLVHHKIGGTEAKVGERIDPGNRRMEQEDTGSRYGGIRLTKRSMGSAEVETGSGHTAAVIAAAPFDYVIDPLLSLATTPVYWVGAGCVLLWQKIF